MFEAPAKFAVLVINPVLVSLIRRFPCAGFEWSFQTTQKALPAHSTSLALWNCSEPIPNTDATRDFTAYKGGDVNGWRNFRNFGVNDIRRRRGKAGQRCRYCYDQNLFHMHFSHFRTFTRVPP